MPAPRRALPSPGPSTHRGFDASASCEYQAVASPTRNSHDSELFDSVARSRSHSHALSAILGGANPRTSVDGQQLQPQRVEEQSGSKSELPLRLARWRRRRRRWRKVLFWLGAALVFVGCFALSFAAPWKWHTLAPVVLGSGLSLLTTLMVLLSFLRRRRHRRRPNELLAFVALSEFGLALLSLTHVLTRCSAQTGVCTPMSFSSCSVAMGFEMFLLLAGVGWFGAAIWHLFVSVSNPFASYRRQVVLSHLLVWGISLVASIVTPVALFSDRSQRSFELSGAQICRAVALVLPLLPADANTNINSRAHRLEQWQQLNMDFWGVLVAIVVLVVVAAQVCLVVGWWRSNSGTVIALKARRRLMKRMAIFVHALNATWLVLLVLFFVYRSSSDALSYLPTQGAAQASDREINLLDALFHFVLTGKGFVTAVVWASVNKPCCVVGFMCCGLHQCSDGDDGPSVGMSGSASSQSASLSGSSNSDIGVARVNQPPLQSATVISMDGGIQQTTVSPNATVLAFDAHESVRESGALRLQDRHSLPSLSSVVGPRSTSSSSSASYEASTVESWEVSQNNETLQREIIYYTVCGITKAIIRSAERARATSTAEGDVAPGEDNTGDLSARNRDGTLVETTLFVGAERDSTLANSSFISHVQSVTILTSPRAYCQPYSNSSDSFRRSILGGDDDTSPMEVAARRGEMPRPTSFTATTSPYLWGQRLHLEHSRSQDSQSPRRARIGLKASNIMFRSFNQTPGRYSLYPVSQVPFELFEQEIELQSTTSSVDDAALSTRTTRSAVFAGLRRTASSAFSQGRGVFRGRSGSTEAAVGRPTGGNMGREFVPEDPKPKTFVDYAPQEFRAIRLAFGLSDEKYLASFRTTAKERVSAGSSGAFMFFSGDNSLLVKSLKEKECRALVDMAPAYASYLTANPHSRLIRFFGCHHVRLYGRNFYFAVMSNVLHNDRHTATITEKYDVKGSWIDRRARRPQRGDRVTCAECDATYAFGGEDDDYPGDTVGADNHGVNDRSVPQFPFHVHRPDVVFKDLDLVRSLKLPRHVAEHLHAQVVADCEFLRDLGIMDYSLLIGVHKCHLRAPRSDGRAASVHAGFQDDFDQEVSIEEPTSGKHLAPLGVDEVYFVGIIDILQQWDWEKQLEKAGKVLLGKSARGISAIAPAAYCRRFQARCTQILLGGAAPEDLDLDWEIDPNAVTAKEQKSRPNSKKMKEMAMPDIVGDQA